MVFTCSKTVMLFASHRRLLTDRDEARYTQFLDSPRYISSYDSSRKSGPVTSVHKSTYVVLFLR